MKKAGLLSTACYGLAMVGLTMTLSVANIPTAHAEDGAATVVAKPVRDWQEPPIQDMTGKDGQAVRKICSIESRFDNEVLMAIMRNKDAEYALRMFFPTMMFAPGVTYPIKLTSGGTTSSYDAVPVYPGTILVELGEDDSLLQAYRDTGSLKITLSKSAFDFKSGNLENGMDLLSACADTLGASVSSAGVAGPLPTSSGTQTAPGMAMPPSVASIDAPSKVEVADLGQADPGAATGHGHVQEQMVLKPLKQGPDAGKSSATDTGSDTSAQNQEGPEKSGFSMFSIFGDVDDETLDGEGAITAEKHYTPGENEPVVAEKSAPADEPHRSVTQNSVNEPEISMGETKQDSPAKMAKAGTQTEPSMGTAVKKADDPVEAEENKATVKSASENPQAKLQTRPDDGRMIVFEEDEPVIQPVPQPQTKPQTKPQTGEIEKVLETVQTSDSQSAADTATATQAGHVQAGNVEARLAELEKRLSAEVERNRQLEMQMRDMTAKPVSGAATIDLDNPDKPAETPADTPAATSTRDRVEAARQERARMKNETLDRRMETLSGLLEQADVTPVARPAPVGSLATDNNAFSWHTGQFYGGAEFGAKPRNVEFSNLVSAYLNATGQRCEGDFASSLDRLEILKNGSIATAELVCVGTNANTAAAVVFYEDSQTFGVITHEGSSDKLTTAIQIRDSIARALEAKL